MKKAGIISMQRIFNYGSFLQAYALKQILKELGCKVEFVDYHVGKCLVSSEQKTGISRKISKVTEVLKYKAPLKEKIKFIKYKKNYAGNYYRYLGITENMNYSPELDLLVIGSDEVFNCVQDNTNVGFSPELFGKNNKAERVITYAASFGNTTVEKLEKYNIKNEISEYLLALNDISVRDTNSGKIVKELISIEPKYNLDPVLIYDYIGKCRKIPKSVNDENYLLLYGYSGRFTDRECRFIRAYAKKKGLKIYCIGGVQNVCDKFIDCDPFTVIAYFKNAECVITDTFHGTIMSIITQQRFVSFVRKAGYGNVEKLTDLLERLGQGRQMVNDVSEIQKKLSYDIDYSRTNDIIKKERIKTYNYLKNQINNI